MNGVGSIYSDVAQTGPSQVDAALDVIESDDKPADKTGKDPFIKEMEAAQTKRAEPETPE